MHTTFTMEDMTVGHVLFFDCSEIVSRKEEEDLILLDILSKFFLRKKLVFWMVFWG